MPTDKPTLRIYVEPGQDDLIRAHAKRQGARNVSEWVRGIVMQEVARREEAERLTTKPRKSRRKSA